MDLSQLSDADLMALKSGGLSKVSDEGLMLLKGNSVAPKTTALQPDVPLVASQMPKQIPIEEPKTSMMDKLKALYEVPATIGSGIVSQPVSMAYGVGRSAIDVAMQGKAPSGESRDEYYRQARQATQFQPTSPASVNALESIGGALEASKLPPYVGNIGIIPSMSNALRNPTIGQSVREAGTVAKAVGENVKPVALNAAETMATALRKKPTIVETAPTSASLAEESTKYFNKAKESGVELNPEYFGNMMKSVGTDLRELGYDARTMPKVAVALEQMQNKEIPKDFQELSVLRKFIRNAQRSKESDEKMVATRLKAEFDDYIANMPDSSVIGGNKEGLADWKKARDTYTKLSKSEVFEDMLDKAEIRDSKLSTEQYLHNKLLQLSEDDKRMRLFTPDEQEAIRKAAQGTNLQNALAKAGKYSIKNISATTLGSILGLGLAGPVGAVIAPTIGGIAKYKATKIRKGDVEKLAAMVRAGNKGTENE
jgi:hypothetical protein